MRVTIRSTRCVGILLLLLMTGGAGHAAVVTGATAPVEPVVFSPDDLYAVELFPVPVQHLAPPPENGGEMTLLRDQYPNWTFTTGADVPGVFNVLQYDPFATGTRGGAEFTVLYDDQAPAARTDYNWIQIAAPHNWGSKDSMVNVDSLIGNSPFYSNDAPWLLPTLATPTAFFGPSIWLDSAQYPQQDIQNPAGGGQVPPGDLLLVDEPWILYSAVGKSLIIGGDDNYSSNDFYTFLATFTWNGVSGAGAGGTVTIHDGLRWGVSVVRVPEPSTFAFSCAVVSVGVLFWWRCRPGGRASESETFSSIPEPAPRA